MKTKVFLSIIASLAMATSAQAFTLLITGGVLGRIQDSTGTFVNGGDIKAVFYDSIDPTSASIADLLNPENYTDIGNPGGQPATFSIGPNNGAISISQGNNITGRAGDDIFLMVFNDEASIATEVGIFTGATWVGGSDNDLEQLSLSFPTSVDNSVWGSLVDNGSGGFHGQTQAIPEPSTYAMALAVLAVVMFHLRRRK